MLTRISNSSLDLDAIPKFESFLSKKSQFSLKILYTSWCEGQITKNLYEIFDFWNFFDFLIIFSDFLISFLVHCELMELCCLCLRGSVDKSQKYFAARKLLTTCVIFLFVLDFWFFSGVFRRMYEIFLVICPSPCRVNPYRKQFGQFMGYNTHFHITLFILRNVTNYKCSILFRWLRLKSILALLLFYYSGFLLNVIDVIYVER